MIRQKPTIWLFMLLLLTTGLNACTGQSSTTVKPKTGPAPSTAVGVADFKSVAGVWEGLLSGMAGSQSQRDWVMMRIGEDGSYEFASFRQIGVFHGSGTLRLSDGRLFLEGPGGGKATFTLYADNARRVLRGEAVANDGRRLTAEMTPKR